MICAIRLNADARLWQRHGDGGLRAIQVEEFKCTATADAYRELKAYTKMAGTFLSELVMT